MMTPNEYKQLVEILVKDEGFRSKPYDDSTGKTISLQKGKISIGIGRNIQEVGISYDEAVTLCINDIRKCRKHLLQLHFYKRLDKVRKFVLLNMCFNLGFGGLCQFKRMLQAIEQENYNQAAKEMLDSKWANQVGKRAKRLAKEMKTGIFSDQS